MRGSFSLAHRTRIFMIPRDFGTIHSHRIQAEARPRERCSLCKMWLFRANHKSSHNGKEHGCALRIISLPWSPRYFFFRKFSVVTRFNQEVNDLSWLPPILFKKRKKDKFSKVVYFSSGVEACKPSDLLSQEGENSHLCPVSALWGVGKEGLVNAGAVGL